MSNIRKHLITSIRGHVIEFIGTVNIHATNNTKGIELCFDGEREGEVLAVQRKEIFCIRSVPYKDKDKE